MKTASASVLLLLAAVAAVAASPPLAARRNVRHHNQMSKLPLLFYFIEKHLFTILYDWIPILSLE